MPKKKSIEQPVPYVWVTQVYMHSELPSVRRYDFVRKAKSGYIVNQRGFDKHIRVAAGRQFFTDELKLWDYVRGYMETRLETMRKRVITYETMLQNPNEAVFIDTVLNSQPVYPKKLELE